MSGDLVAFLRARLDEDERTASEATGDEANLAWFTPKVAAQWFDLRIAAHIVAHDPARVLREVEAKRAILDRFEQIRATWRDSRGGGTAAGVMGFVIARIVAVYSDHPDYRPEWKP